MPRVAQLEEHLSSNQERARSTSDVPWTSCRTPTSQSSWAVLSLTAARDSRIADTIEAGGTNICFPS